LRGRDIKRYGFDWAGLYLISMHNGIPEKGIPEIDIAKYPVVKQHLDCYWKQIKQRADQGATPYHLRSCAYTEDFSKPKIVWGEISDKTKFALDKEGAFYTEATTFLMTGTKLSYLVCFLNSALSEYLFSKIGTTTGVGTIRWKKFTIEQLPVPTVTKDQEGVFEKLLAGEADKKAIDRAVCELCQLTEEEVAFINDFVR
jgi:hypothetical protein